MKKKALLLVGLIILPVLTLAQYTGGSYDGYDNDGENNSILRGSDCVYHGGSYDGYAKGETAEGGSTLPVELSTFTAQFLNGVPTLYWKTESETDNIGWYVS